MAEQLQGLPIYQGEPSAPWISTDTEDRAKQTIVSTLLMSAEHYRPMRRNWDDYYDRYTGQPLTKLRQTNRIRSNVPSGKVSEMIDTYRADLLTKMLKNRPLVAAIPQETTDIEISRVREELIQFQVDNATPDMGFWPIADQVILNVLIWGIAPVKNVWTQRTRKFRIRGLEERQSQISYRGPIPIPRFPYDVFPHPHKVWADDGYGVVDVSYESFDKLESLRAAGVYTDAIDQIPDMKDIENPQFLGGDAKGVLMAFGDLYEKMDQRQRLGWTRDNRLDQDGVLVMECECMFRHKLDEPPVRSILTMANGVVIRVSETPLPSGNSVWNFVKVNHLPGQLYGMSMVEKNKPQIHVFEVIQNMVLQNLAQSVNKMKVLRRDLLESATSLDDQPGGIIFAKPGPHSLSEVVREIQISPIGQDAFAMMRMVSEQAQGTSGATDLKTGRIGSGETTATESNIAFSQASQRFRFALEWIGASWILPMARKWDDYNQAYLDLPYIHRVVGGSATFFQKVEEQHLSIPVDYVFVGPTRDENDALRIAQLENALKIVTPYIQFIPGIDVVVKKTVLHLLDILQVPDIDQIKKILNPDQTGPLLEQQGQGSGLDQSINRQDRRLGHTDSPPTSETDLANSLGGLLAGGS